MKEEKIRPIGQEITGSRFDLLLFERLSAGDDSAKDTVRVVVPALVPMTSSDNGKDDEAL